MTPTFIYNPMHYTIPEFRAMLAGLPLGEWRPKFPTLHNTGVPSLAQWMAYAPTPQERWGANLNRYYQGMGWHAGPHLVVCPNYVWVLCDLMQPGVSVSCWNSETFGIEMVGNYEVGGDDFSVGEGAKVRDNATAVLAALAEKFGWGDLAQIAAGSKGLHFHHDCARDRHACPGSKVSKRDILGRIAALRGPLPAVTAPAAVPFERLAPEHMTLPDLVSVSDIQAALNRINLVSAAASPSSIITLMVDDEYGEATRAAVETFQQANRLTADGWVGRETHFALVGALKRLTA